MLLGDLILRGGKTRFTCAAAGVAIAAGAVVFMFSLAATNRAQAPSLAARAAAPWAAWEFDSDGEGRAGLVLKLVGMTVDLRPGGHVMQGPPLRAVLAKAPAANPYGCTKLAEGRWVDQACPGFEIVCTRNSLVRFGHGDPPPLGSRVKFVGQHGTMTGTVVGYLDDAKLPPGWPGFFVNDAAFAAVAGEPHGTLALYRDATASGLLTPAAPSVVRGFQNDEQRRMDYARPLLLAGAVLLALCLLVNSLLLSIEANRRTLAILRTVGLTRLGVVRIVATESLAATLAGLAVGCGAGIATLVVYVAADPVAFPAGPSISAGIVPAVAALALLVAGVAVLFALWPALSVRPLEEVEARPRRRRRGMAVAFACGYAAFVAVEVWGASLMRAFMPSPEWPDAIVSILPGGVSSFDVDKLRSLPGVKRISELYPLQLNFEPEEPMEMPQGRGGRGNPRPCRNALFLAAEWLPEFRFVEGTRAKCEEALRTTDACVITEMMSRARNLHVGDVLRVAMGGRGEKTVVELPVAGVVDLNWHMVTSRGLVRGLNRMPVMTDGPVFVSLDTIESLDVRPSAMVRMTHLWVEYEPGFLAEKGVFPAGRAVEEAIVAALGNPAGSTVRLHARDEIADGTLAHGSDVIGQAARVPFVFLLVLSFGFIAMLVADAEASRRMFAMLRAVGATRAQLAARLAAAALRTAAWGVAFGLPAGALAGWLFSVKTGSAWPGLPHYFVVPARILAEGTAGALVFVLLVAVPTALSLLPRRH